MPVKQQPFLCDFPEKFDACFKIEEEPRQMALGIAAAIILVDITEVNTYAEII